MLKKLRNLLFFIMMLFSVTIFGADLEKGIYSIQNETYHDNPVGAGMSRSYTEAQSKVEVVESGTYIHLGFNNTDFMGDFIIKVNGSKVAYEVAKHDASTQIKELKFKVGSLSDTVTVGLHVIPMDTTVEYQVTFNEGTLTLVKKAEVEVDHPVKEEIKAESQDMQQSQVQQPVKETVPEKQEVKQEITQATQPESTSIAKSDTTQEEMITENTKTNEISAAETEKMTEEADEIKEVEVTVEDEALTEEVVEESVTENEETEEIAVEEEGAIEETNKEVESASKWWMLYAGIAVVAIAVVGFVFIRNKNMR